MVMGQYLLTVGLRHLRSEKLALKRVEPLPNGGLEAPNGWKTSPQRTHVKTLGKKKSKLNYK